MSLFRRSSNAVISAAAASTSRPMATLPTATRLLAAGPSRSQLDHASSSSSSCRSFSSSPAHGYPRAQTPRAKLSSEFEPEPRPTSTTTTTVDFESALEDDDLFAPAALEQEALATEAELTVQLPAEMNEQQAVEFESMLSRNEIQKYNKTHVFCRHVPHGVDNAALKAAFEVAGILVKNARVLAYPRSDGRFISRGYGWVSLEREKDMRDALRLDGMKINDIPIQIEQMRQRPYGSYDRPPKPEPVMPPGYYDRLPPRESRRPHLIDDGSSGYGVKGGSFDPTGGAAMAKQRKAAKYSKSVSNKRHGPRPGDRESDVDWAGWQGARRGAPSREEAEFVGGNSRGAV